MPDEQRPSRNKFRIIRIIITLAFLALLTYIAFVFISGRGLNFDWFTDIIFPPEQVQPVDELHFNIGRGRVFADLNGAIAAAGSLGIQVLDYGGNELLRDSFAMNTPGISSQNEHAIAFDIGGTEARVFNTSDVIASITKEGPIVSASINENGWFTISAQEGERFRGRATVYNSSGSRVYRVSLSTGYILSSVLSSDNETLAILNLTDYGSRITFYHGLNEEEPDGTFELPDVLIIDIQFLASGDLLAVTTESFILIDPHEISGWEMYTFSGMRLGGYSINDDFIALHLLDFGIGHRGKLILIDHFGNLYGELITDRELISMSLLDDNLYVMLGDGLVILDRNFRVRSLPDESPSAAGVSRIIALNNEMALIAGDRFAIIVR